MPSTASSSHGTVRSFIARRKTGILLAVSALALSATFLGNTATGAKGIEENRVVRFVNEQYRLLSDGRYDALSENMVEGLWKREAGGYGLVGLALPTDAARQLEDDLGVGGWRLHFVTLKAEKYSVVARDAFANAMKRESEILDTIDPLKRIRTVHVVTMSGHNTGRCSIVEWKRDVPVVEVKGRYTIIMRGTPQVYSLVHNEQWFQPVRF